MYLLLFMLSFIITTAIQIHISYTAYTDTYQTSLAKYFFIIPHLKVPIPTPTSPSQQIADCLIS